MKRITLVLVFMLLGAPAFANPNWDNGEESGEGGFDQHMNGPFLKKLMKIPEGLTNVDIEVTATDDYFIVLSDRNEKIIYGYIGNSLTGKKEIDYKDLVIVLKEHKRYNGHHHYNKQAKASLKIRGELPATLRVSIRARVGTKLAVNYKWGKGVGKPCGSRNLKPCQPGLVCKDGVDGNIAVDVPGECHTKMWCEVEKDCRTLEKVDGPAGQYVCQNQRCVWEVIEQTQCEQDGGYCTHFLKECESGFYGVSALGCPLGRSGKCCLTKAQYGASCDAQKKPCDERDGLVCDSKMGVCRRGEGEKCRWHSLGTYECESDLKCHIYNDMGTAGSYGTCVSLDYCETEMDCDGMEAPSSDGEWSCEENTCTWIPEATCRDFGDIDFGHCLMMMGYGVVDGVCEPISGCGSQGYTFFETREDCQQACEESRCGASRNGYTVVRPDQIANLDAGRNAQVTWPVRGGELLTLCTKKLCRPQNPCCNRCNTTVSFAGHTEARFVCGGNECDIEEKCQFDEGEIVTVYGQISEYGTILPEDICKGGAQELTLDDEKENGYKKYNIINPRTPIRFSLERGPIHPCYGGPWQIDTLKYDDEDLELFAHNVVPNPNCFGLGCSSMMDEIIMLPTNDYVETIFVVKKTDAPGFCYQDNPEAVEDARIFDTRIESIPCPMYYPPHPDYCAAGHWVPRYPSGDMSHCSLPWSCELDVHISFDKRSYLPNQIIERCVVNQSEVTIYLPGCSVFLTDGQPDITCVWEGYVKELLPGDELCFASQTGEKPGDYNVTSQFKVKCEPNDTYSSCTGYERQLEERFRVIQTPGNE